MLAILNFSVCEVEQFGELSLSLFVFSLDGFLAHDFETVLLE